MTYRVQRSRRKGSRLAPGAVCCTRPGKWGNPFPAKLFRYCQHDSAVRMPVESHRLWLIFDPKGQEIAEMARRELQDKPLACWCALTAPCHCDNLIAAADGTLTANLHIDTGPACTRGKWYLETRQRADGKWYAIALPWPESFILSLEEWRPKAMRQPAGTILPAESIDRAEIIRWGWEYAAVQCGAGEKQWITMGAISA